MVAILGLVVAVGVNVGVPVIVGIGVPVGSVGVVLGVNVAPGCWYSTVACSTSGPGVQVNGTAPGMRMAVADGKTAAAALVGSSACPGST